MKEQIRHLPEYLGAHVQLTLVALLFGVAVSVPLGILLTRKKWLEHPVREVAGIIQTIPSLALLAMMVPALAAVGAESIGYVPALIALSLYSILPILATTVTGLNEVNPAMIEAARGVGMTPWQELSKVQLPLAMPMIVTGIRTAAVWTVGMATLSTPVGATSLGNYIFSGLQTRNNDAILVGCVAAAGLAIVLDRVVRSLERGVRTRQRRPIAISLGVLLLLYGYVGVSGVAALTGGERAELRIGAKTFTEQYILSEVIAEHIQRKGGPRAELVQSLGSSVAFDALAASEIDLYVDYSGTLWANVMGREDRPDRATVLRELTGYLKEEHGVELIGALGFENTYALVMGRAHAARLGVTKISDLTRHAPELTMGGDFEFFERPEWRAIKDAYGLDFQDRRTMDPSLMYGAVGQESVHVIAGYSTDGRIAALDLVVLEDDRGAIPPYDAVMLASPRLAREAPARIEEVGSLSGAIDDETMRRMNFEVDVKQRSAAEVARELLDRVGAAR